MTINIHSNQPPPELIANLQTQMPQMALRYMQYCPEEYATLVQNNSLIEMTHLSCFHITSIHHLTTADYSLPISNLYRPLLFHSALLETYRALFFSSRVMGQESILR